MTTKTKTTLITLAEWALVAAAIAITYNVIHYACKDMKEQVLCVPCSHITLSIALVLRLVFWYRRRSKYNSKTVIR